MKNQFSKFLFASVCAVVFTACGNDDEEVVPDVVEEKVVESFTDVTLTFISATDTVVAKAQDPDGEGAQELKVLDEIHLKANTEYTMNITILNDPDGEHEEDEDHDDHEGHDHKLAEEDHDHEHGENVTEEIEEEADEHQVFFAFTENAFSNPTGTGNITGTSTINYNDKDKNGNPLGLSTTWTTAGELEEGTFQVRLQHQPDVKSATSGANDGDTDFDLTFELEIEEEEEVVKDVVKGDVTLVSTKK